MCKVCSRASARQSQRLASKVTSTALPVRVSNSNVACQGPGTNRQTSLTQARAHQPVPQTSNSCDKRSRLKRPKSPALSRRTTCCRRQAPTNAASPSTKGVQKPAWASGRKPALLNTPNSSGLAPRNATPPTTCNSRPKMKLARCCKCRLSQMISKPLPPHTALAVCQGRTNSTARLISSRPASSTSDSPRNKRTSLRTS